MRGNVLPGDGTFVGELAPDRWLIGSPQWVVPAAILFGLVAAIAGRNYLRGRLPTGVGWAAGGLRLLAIGLVAVCLVEPKRSGQRARPGDNVLPIVVDNSLSMTVAPRPGGETVSGQVVAALQPDAAWRTRLEQDFDVRPYAVDARVRPIDDFGSLAFDGIGSSLHDGLRAIGDRFGQRPVGGVLLFTDGNATDLPPDGSEIDWSGLGFPVYPVRVREDEGFRDLKIADVSVRQTDFESAPLTVSATLQSTSLAGESAVVQLHEVGEGRLIEERTVTLDAGDGATEPVRFRFRPRQSGVGFFRIVTFLERDRQQFDTGESRRESTLANNERLLVAERASGPYRILYVAGRPNWEFKFLRRALDEDAEVQLVGLLRIAKEQPKFSFRDRGVRNTNPLFQGLGEDEEEASEQYDEPVFVRLGVRDSDELIDGFPRTAEDLFPYHAVILDDLEPEFFDQDQLLLLRRFVASRGGGLLFLGGEESFAGRRFGDSPLGELSPVYAPRRGQSNPSGGYRLGLTREGMLQPWLRLRETEQAERDRLRQMPPFMAVNALGGLKPGASLLATARSGDGEEQVALAAQRFGRGRTAALPVTDLWRWSMRRPGGGGGDPSPSGISVSGPRDPAPMARGPDGASRSNAPTASAAGDPQDRHDPAQAWRQIVHWLVNEVPRRAEVRVESPEDPAAPVRIVATARDEDYLPLDNAQVTLRVTPLGGEPFTIRAEPDGERPGIYAASYWSPHRGLYRVDASIRAADGSEVGDATSGWASDPAAAEMRRLGIDRDWLETVARETGGEVVSADRLESFVADLPNRKMPVVEIWEYPVWHRPWIMLAAMLCLCTEWGLRRWKGLP